ncbi:MAG: threonine-phosphate decarboxylase CobD [Christensenellaceae bacterium]|nr:threonine-phosphate decarboxylase CobD [Christensenellaceae bacterium]MEA5066705.1 threonine-phosphate decarboxylase CobD [Eubacteriales bacterium]MEA5068472.1 threonine-phosphate decarboxylase CobD [Christensenellaceae bacterium]
MPRYEHGGDRYANAGISLDFSINVNPLGAPEAAKRAVIEQTDAFARYPDPRCRALREALARKHGVAPEAILCGNGASDLIFRACACLKPRRALTLAPTFSEYERPAKLFGGEVREHRLREADGFMLTEEVLPALTPDIDLFFLCNPNNPTGRLAAPDLLRRVVGACAENGTLLMVDECFMEFTQGASMLPLLRACPNLLILRAFTKFHALAGLRLGYLLGDAALLARVADFAPAWSVSAAAQAAGLGALAEPGWAERTREVVRAERAFMEEGLAALGLAAFPSDANFLLFKSPVPLFEPLKARGILVRNCGNFTGLDERFTRVGLKTREDNATLLRAIREVLYG